MSERLAPTSAEHSAILSCLSRIRMRLWAVRLIERIAIALAWAAAVSVFVTLAHWMNNRWQWASLLIAAIPLAASLWLWAKASHLARPASMLAGGGGITPPLLRLCAVLTALASATAIVILACGLAPSAPTWLYPLATGALFLLVSAATVRPVKPAAAAIFVDQQVGLSERVSTALEFFQTQPSSQLEAAFRTPVIASAIKACNTVRHSRVGYTRIDSRLYPLAAVVAIAAAAVCLIPPMQAQGRPSRAPYLTVVRHGNALAEKIKELEHDPKLAEDPRAKALLRQFNQIAADMKKGEMSPFEAQERMASAMSGIKQQEDAAQAATEVEKAFSRDFSELGRAGEELRTATVNGNKGDSGAPQKKQSAKNEVNKAADKLGEKLKGMSEQEKKELAGKLDKDAQQAAGDPALKKDLQSAAQAAREGNSEKLSQSMADAANRTAQQGAEAPSQEQLQQTLRQIAEAESGGLSEGEQRARQNSGGEQSAGSQQQSASGQNSGGSGEQQNGDQGSQSSQANGGQQGSGKGSNPGEGKQGSGGDGNGSQQGNASSNSTNLHAPSGPGDEHAGGPIGGSETYVRIYDEKAIASRGTTERTRGKINPLGAPSGTVEVRGQGDQSDPSIRTYQEALPAVRKKSLDDLQTQQIPPQYKDLIRSYYDEKK